MKTKPFFKSKTVNSALVIIVIAALNLLGIGEAEIGATYDTITTNTGTTTESAKDLTALVAGAVAIYGRFRADTKLGKAGDNED